MHPKSTKNPRQTKFRFLYENSEFLKTKIQLKDINKNLYHVIIIVKGFIIMGNPPFFFYKIEPIFSNFTQIERWWGFNWQLIEEMWS